jgi:hypothetical protein
MSDASIDGRAARPLLFQPFAVRSLTLKNRLCILEPARLRTARYGAAALARFAAIGCAGLPSRSSRSERRLVSAEGLEPSTP